MSTPRRSAPSPAAASSSSKLFRERFPLAELDDFRTSAWSSGVAQHPNELQPIFPTTLHALVAAAKLGGKVGMTLVQEDGETEEHLAYDDLLARAQGLAGRFAQRGVKPGDRVLLVLPTGFDFVCAFYGTQLAGAVPVPAYPPAALERAGPAIERLCLIGNHAQASLCVTDDRLKLVLGQVAQQVRSLRAMLTVNDILSSDTVAAYPADPNPDELAFIQYTSGSTGNPHGVALTHRNVVSNIHAIGQASHISRHDVSVSWLPLYHDMGIIGGMMFPIYWRLPFVLMSPMTFLMQPEAWLWAIHRHRGTFSCAPNFAYGRCVKRIRAGDIEDLDLSSWRVSLNGAEPVNYRTVRDFQETFGPYGYSSHTMLPAYGLAETTVGAAFPAPGSKVRYEVVDRGRLADGYAVRSEGGPESMAVVSVGKAIPGHSLRVVDDRGKIVPEREVGHIVLSGPSVMKGYYRDPGSTVQVLQEGWLWTGDLGYLSDGELFITGRVKDLIICRGKNYYAEDIERVVERLKGVRLGGAVAFGQYNDGRADEQVVVVAETRVRDDAARKTLIRQIKSAVDEHCGLRVNTVALVAPGTVPKTPSGKRQRRLTASLYTQGKLERQAAGRLSSGWIVARSLYGHALARLRRRGSSRRDEA